MGNSKHIYYSRGIAVILLLLPFLSFGQIMVGEAGVIAQHPATGNPYTHSYSVSLTGYGSGTITNLTIIDTFILTALKTTGSGGSVQHTVTYNGQTVPADVVFSTSSSYGTFINWGIKYYNASTGLLVVILEIPSYNSSTGATVYMGIGSASTTLYQGGSVGSEYPSSVIASYPEPNGATLSALDFSSHGNNGMISGATAVPGFAGGSAAFNGSSQYISLPNIGVTTGARTVSLWIQGGVGSTQYELFTWGQNITSQSFSILLNSVGAGTIYFYGVNNDAYAPIGTVSNTGFHNIVVKYDGGVMSSSTMHIYYDSSPQFLTFGGGGTLSTADMNYLIGRLAWGGTGYVGDIENVRLDNTNISDNEILVRYDLEYPGNSGTSLTLIY